MAGTFRVNPIGAAPVLRCAGSLKGATSRGLREFPAGLRSVEAVGLPELVKLAADGCPLPVAARQRLEVYKAVQCAKVKAAAKAEAIRDKARKEARAKREAAATERAALKARQKAERAAERKRNAAAERRAKRKAEEQVLQQQTLSAAVPTAQPPTVALMVDASDTRLPWED